MRGDFLHESMTRYYKEDKAIGEKIEKQMEQKKIASKSMQRRLAVQKAHEFPELTEEQRAELEQLWIKKVVTNNAGRCGNCGGIGTHAVRVEYATLKDGTENLLFNLCPASGVCRCSRCANEFIVFDDLTDQMIKLLYEAGETAKFRNNAYKIAKELLTTSE